MDRIDIEHLEVSTESPNLEYEPGSFTLAEILDSYLLPMVVQLDNQKHHLPFTEFNFDLSQPLVLYKKRNIQKVPAISVTIDEGQYVDVGESLLIPEDYKGWFAVLQRWNGNEKADDHVPHFETVEELANSNTDKFLIGGTRSVNGLHVFERSQSQLNHEQRHFDPGDILIRDKIYFGETKKRTRLFRKPKYTTEKFLFCRDETDREILLPFEQKGIFYQVSERSGKPNHNVMQMSDIVARNLPPRIIKLVFGRFPVTPCCFTGLMKADTARLESSIIAATIINEKNVLIEIPLNADMYFRIVKLTDELKNHKCYKSAMSLCMERATTYMRNIKVCYNFSCKEDENIQAIKKESDMDLISSDEGNDGSQSPRDLKSEAKKSTSLKRKSRKTKSLERNNNLLDQTGKKSSFKRGGSKKTQTNQLQNAIGDYSSIDMRTQNGSSTRFSHEVDTENVPSIRPARALSTGRMSFCFGNSYLTVPMFAPDLSTLSEDKNKSCAELSEIQTDSLIAKEAANFPLPMPCTSIGSYVNTGADSSETLDVSFDKSRRPSDVIYNANFGNISTDSDADNEFQFGLPGEQSSTAAAPKDSESNNSFPVVTSDKMIENERSQDQDNSDCDDYIPVSHSRRPSSKPPESAPPPVPAKTESSITRNSICSTSDDSVSEDRVSSRLSACLFQYDTPKSKEENSPSSVTSLGNSQPEKTRRPSTFTFTEGLCGVPNSERTNMRFDDGFPGTTGDSPVYENIQALQELLEDLEITSSDIINMNREHKIENKPNCPDENETSMLTDKTEETGNAVIKDLDLPTNNTALAETDGDTESVELIVPTSQFSEHTNLKLEKTTSVESNSSKISKQNSLTDREKSIEELTVDEFIAQLEQIGIRDNSLNTVKELEIDGKFLASVAHDDECLKERLPDVSLIDLQKISMFLRGWRPHEEC